MDQERFLAKLESLITWISNRPQNYCFTVGELDTLLHFLHTAWAKGASREDDLDRAFAAAVAWPQGKLEESERVSFLRENPPVLSELIAYWHEVDAALNLRYHEDWDDHGETELSPADDAT
jgi:hypothetical protein